MAKLLSRPLCGSTTLRLFLMVGLVAALFHYTSPFLCSSGVSSSGSSSGGNTSPRGASTTPTMPTWGQRHLESQATQCGHKYLEGLLPPMSRSPPTCPEGILKGLASGVRSGGVNTPFKFGGACGGMKWYSPQEACDLLQAAGSLVLVGDSLQRHLAQALFSVLSGNIRHGATLPHMLPKDHPHLLDLCTCDKMYDDHAEHGGDRRCRDASSANLGSSAPGSQSMMCPNWRRNHVHFWFVAASEKPGEGDTPWTFRANSFNELVERLAREGKEDSEKAAAERAAAAGAEGGGGGVEGGGATASDAAGAGAGVGGLKPTRSPSSSAVTPGTGVMVHFAPPVLHVGMQESDHVDTSTYFLEPMFKGVTAGMGAYPGRRRVACVGLPARQANAPPQYMEKQGNHKVLPHNAWLKGACEEGAKAAGLGSTEGGGKGTSSIASGLDAAYSGMWDSFAFTLNHTSHDGAHYDTRINVLLAQALLNLVQQEMGV